MSSRTPQQNMLISRANTLQADLFNAVIIVMTGIIGAFELFEDEIRHLTEITSSPEYRLDVNDFLENFSFEIIDSIRGENWQLYTLSQDVSERVISFFDEYVDDGLLEDLEHPLFDVDQIDIITNAIYRIARNYEM